MVSRLRFWASVRKRDTNFTVMRLILQFWDMYSRAPRKLYYFVHSPSTVFVRHFWNFLDILIRSALDEVDFRVKSHNFQNDVIFTNARYPIKIRKIWILTLYKMLWKLIPYSDLQWVLRTIPAAPPYVSNDAPQRYELPYRTRSRWTPLQGFEIAWTPILIPRWLTWQSAIFRETNLVTYNGYLATLTQTNHTDVFHSHQITYITLF